MDTFTIYQLKDDDDIDLHLLFQNFDRITRHGFKVDKKNYNQIWKAPLNNIEGKSEDILDRLYYIFNMEHPKAYPGRSLSVSDVVVLHRGDADIPYYVDSIGYKRLINF